MDKSLNYSRVLVLARYTSPQWKEKLWEKRVKRRFKICDAIISVKYCLVPYTNLDASCKNVGNCTMLPQEKFTLQI